jgi:N-acetylglucosaminyl-diphospho-decaprenol L-rhamnosyltransferase
MADLDACPQVHQVILTRNIPECAPDFEPSSRLLILDNPQPQGFGANHNAAFRHVQTPYFAILNPDIRLHDNPFPALLAVLDNPEIALSAPLVVNPHNAAEDSVRRFPTLSGLLLKALSLDDGRFRVGNDRASRPVPWVAGMFMLARRLDYASAGGFDEGFFLYYEDVDLCVRLWRSGRQVMFCPDVRVVHDARRASRRNPRYMMWHLASMLRYFRKHLWRLPHAQLARALQLQE